MQHDTNTSSLLSFYRGAAPDDRGRMIAEIIAWPDQDLEWHHDFIQWLFPLRERSGANPGAPTLTPSDIAAFRAEPALRAQLRAAFERMLWFYGFTLDTVGGAPRVRKDPDWEQRHQNWLQPYNHNFLRISRILQCLMLLGLPAEARALFAALEELYGSEEGRPIGETTWGYWRRAVQDG